MALPQIVTKTYSRRRSRQADVSHAERTFDELFRGASRPPARAAATAEKWGSASFKRICNTTRTSPKHRLSPTRHADDPFSFDSDDDNIAKKSRKENVRQKTSDPKPTVDGKYSAAEKSRTRTTMNFKEKSSADVVDSKQQLTSRRDESRTKQSVEKVTRWEPSAKSVDCADSERNGLSAYRMSTVLMSDRGDSSEMSDRKYRANGSTGCCDKKPSSPVSERHTRSSVTPSPCKSTQQLKVFVDNFSQLLSSQRSSAGKRSQPELDISGGTLSSAARLDSPVKKLKSSENCDSDVERSQLPSLCRSARDAHRTVSSIKSETASSSAVQRNKKLHQRNSDDDIDIDDDSVIMLSRVNSAHRATDPSRTSRSGTRTRDTANCRESLSTKTAGGRISRDDSAPKCTGSSGNNKNESVSSKSGQSRSHRWRTSATRDSEPATAATSSATATSTCTRRLLTGSQKVLSFTLMQCILC